MREQDKKRFDHTLKDLYVRSLQGRKVETSYQSLGNGKSIDFLS